MKAGSKVYVPNGFEADGTTPKFDVITISSDMILTRTWGGTTVQLVLFYDKTHLNLSIVALERCSSGTTAPTATNTQYWYDTTNNLIKRYSGGNDQGESYSLPLAFVHIDPSGGIAETNVITSIDQVFNGFGYIGSTVFALPGVKVQIPNGRNEDGTCKSLITNTTSVKTLTVNASWGTYDIFITRSGVIGRWPDIASGSAGTRYNAATNYYEVISNGKWIPQLDCVFVKIKTDTTSPYKITSFEPYTVDSILNSNLSNLSPAGEAKLKSNIQLVNELPANPEPGVLYCIPEA